MAKSNKKKIVLDTDVISHFVRGDQIYLLPKIFKEEKIILDIVKEELEKHPIFKPFSNNLGMMKNIRVVAVGDDLNIYREYARLKKQFGKGESACMAYCKYTDDVLASSNVKDVKKYCDDNNITWLTTLDFLVKALEDELLDEAACDFFIYNVKSQGGKLPCNTISEYIDNFDVKRI